MKTNQIIIGVVALAVVAGVGVVALGDKAATSGPGPLDGFAQCIKDSGAVFYGAYWCPHCQNQKKLFGNSAKLLPYVECSTPDGKAQLPVCLEKGIKSYPTWKFPDGTEQTGEVPLATLAAKTGCALTTDTPQISVDVVPAAASPAVPETTEVEQN